MNKRLIATIVFIDIICYISYSLHILFFGYYYENKISGNELLDYWGLTGFFTIIFFLILLRIYVYIIQNKRRIY